MLTHPEDELTAFAPPLQGEHGPAWPQGCTRFSATVSSSCLQQSCGAAVRVASVCLAAVAASLM